MRTAGSGSSNLTELPASEFADPASVAVPAERRGPFQPPPRGGAKVRGPWSVVSGPWSLELDQAEGWRRRMDAGEFATSQELAAAVGLAERHVSRQLRLAYLAPEVLKRLTCGREARGRALPVFARNCLKMTGFPTGGHPNGPPAPKTTGFPPLAPRPEGPAPCARPGTGCRTEAAPPR